MTASRQSAAVQKLGERQNDAELEEGSLQDAGNIPEEENSFKSPNARGPAFCHWCPKSQTPLSSEILYYHHPAPEQNLSFKGFTSSLSQSEKMNQGTFHLSSVTLL